MYIVYQKTNKSRTTGTCISDNVKQIFMKRIVLKSFY